MFRAVFIPSKAALSFNHAENALITAFPLVRSVIIASIASAVSSGICTIRHAPVAVKSSLQHMNMVIHQQARLDQGMVRKRNLKVNRVEGINRASVPPSGNGLRGPSIRTDKPSASQQYATEPACDENDHAGQLLAINRLKNGFSRRSARFTIIVEAVGLADPPGPAIVVGVSVALLVDKSLGTCLISHGSGNGQKAALLDVLLEAMCGCQGEHEA